MKNHKTIVCVLSAALSLCLPPDTQSGLLHAETVRAAEASSDFQAACDWIWTNRIEPEESVKDRSTIFDQIIAGNGTLQYLLIWQSYEPITLPQRKKLPQMLEDAINQWTDCLIGCDDWPYDRISVKIVGYAVLDSDCLTDLQPDETVYTDTEHSWLRDGMIGTMGDKTIPVLAPAEPTEYSRYLHWNDPDWNYGGSYDNRYDMFLHGIKGMFDGCGYGCQYGQILSDCSVLGLIDGTASPHILLHETGHGFGFPDYYGGEGASDGYPPGGFPGGAGSVMAPDSCTYINDFDAYFLRYAWNRLKSEDGRFQIGNGANRIPGDINSDDALTTADAVLLQKWLLAEPDVQIADWNAGDISNDHALNAADLCLMKRLLLNR